MRVIKAPGRVPDAGPALFLAGSIDMGRAVDWQSQVTEALADIDPLVVLNPRRDDWDSSWRQSIDDPQFRTQVEWELAGLARADCVAMYLAPETRAPISLLELGLCAGTGKLVVCCPDGYWRKGNVDVVCRRYAVEQTADLDGLVAAVRARLNRLSSRAQS